VDAVGAHRHRYVCSVIHEDRCQLRLARGLDEGCEVEEPAPAMAVGAHVKSDAGATRDGDCTLFQVTKLEDCIVGDHM
jgi:hypothetical protein